MTRKDLLRLGANVSDQLRTRRNDTPGGLSVVRKFRALQFEFETFPLREGRPWYWQSLISPRFYRKAPSRSAARNSPSDRA